MSELTSFHIRLRDLIEQLHSPTFAEIMAKFNRPVGCESSDVALAIADLVDNRYVKYAHNRKAGYAVTGKLPPRTLDDTWDW